ncbi:inositol monophosphatase family protein [Halobaculum gomorrense]|uniref:fructose-bisphosphatase n=1 Tax=Halobaculum gomorrense TaxID=43928 RepID=A0A1M5R6U0_9EURY|nr:inositol monophosphatase [Halobaculum gomorrense]SHH21689.1 myo-inositol-1(or 4)-monophosphatase [Halobaculum gomorrense]
MTDEPIPSADADDRLAAAVAAAERGGAVALDSFRSALDVETKADGPMDAVTAVDRAVQERIFESVGDAYPDDAVVGEEGDALKTVPDTGAAWVVDPIDGTVNYAKGNRVWMTSIAVCRDGEPVAAANYAPATDDLYVAGSGDARRNGDPVTVGDTADPNALLVNPVFGVSASHRRELSKAVDTVCIEFGDVRRFGCAQAALSGVATGELDAVASTVELNAWDTAAGVHLIRRAGGRATDVHGDRWRPGSTGLIASNGEAHDALVDAFDPVE